MQINQVAHEETSPIASTVLEGRRCNGSPLILTLLLFAARCDSLRMPVSDEPRR
jgi:hypothetical protein